MLSTSILAAAAVAVVVVVVAGGGGSVCWIEVGTTLTRLRGTQGAATMLPLVLWLLLSDWMMVSLMTSNASQGWGKGGQSASISVYDFPEFGTGT